jgi:hypothetical protein
MMSALRPRLAKIVDLHGDTLLTTIKERTHNVSMTSDDLIRRFAEFDPTIEKSRTQWLIKTYIADKHFKMEDLGRAQAALTVFTRCKHRLPIEQRELSRFKSLSALEDLVAPFIHMEEQSRLERDLSSVTGREKRRLEDQKARDESLTLQEQKGHPTIAVPMTEFASCWWGRGTRWCTASRKENAFLDYNHDAPLIVIVDTDGAKFQMFVTHDDIQFMDAPDKDVSLKIMRQRWSSLETLMRWALQKNGSALKYFPIRHRTPDVCQQAVSQCGMALQYVPRKRCTLDIIHRAIRQNGLALRYGIVFKFIPEDYCNEDLYRIAVASNGSTLLDIPQKYHTEEFYNLAIMEGDPSQDKNNGWALGLIPSEYRTPELCHHAITKNGSALKFVPAKLKTEELCRIAVTKCRLAMPYVPTPYKTDDLYRLAITHDGWALQYVPIDHRNADLCRLAVEQNREAMPYVPESQKTPDLYRILARHLEKQVEKTNRLRWSPQDLDSLREMLSQYYGVQ